MINTFDLPIQLLVSAGSLLFLYAEIHFRMKGLPNFLFKKEPEIVLDMPWRVMIGNPVPLFLFVKDAHQFPVKLKYLHIRIHNKDENISTSLSIALDKVITDPFYWETIEIPAEKFSTPGNYLISAELTFEVNGRQKKLIQDNYRGIPHPPFDLLVSSEELPALQGWQWGDLHLHSNYTSDQLEFGAPIEAIVQAARCLGLSFVAVTDHSYDLDDEPDDYLTNHPNFPKWKTFLQEVFNLQNKYPDFGIIPGEEISLGNCKNQNVHCLLLGDDQFFPGVGDGGERFFRNQPSLSLQEVLQQKSGESCIVAAHPRITPPLSQRFLLNRGHWHLPDLLQPGLEHWQILNGQVDSLFHESLQLWIRALLQGEKIGIIAGTDAHGNFNCYRQVQIPFLKLKYSRKFILGKVRTGIKIKSPVEKAVLLRALRQKRAVISTGPALDLEIHTKNHIYEIGDTLPNEPIQFLQIRASSTAEFGELQEIRLFKGDLQNRKELQQTFPSNVTYSFRLKIPFSREEHIGYIRGEVISKKGEHLFYAFSNPIWFQR